MVQIHVHTLIATSPPSPSLCSACGQQLTPLLQPVGKSCLDCGVNFCQTCTSERQTHLHDHSLWKVDAQVVYGSGVQWGCDICKEIHSSDQPVNNPKRYPSQCSACCFDVCDDCLAPLETPYHPHVLNRFDSRVAYPSSEGTWSCDHCHQSFTSNVEAKFFPFHCDQCSFDLCDSCAMNVDVGVDICDPYPPSVKELHNFMSVPAEQDGAQIHDGVADNRTCLICSSRPRDVTLVHGSTGHVCCCSSCAGVLWESRDPCPVCRAEIDRVIKHYNA